MDRSEAFAAFHRFRPAAKILASLLLIVALFVVGAISNRPLSPISVELAAHSGWAILIFVCFAFSLALHIDDCRRLGWNWLMGLGILVTGCLAVVAFTSPWSVVHLTAFGVLLAFGIPWLIAYARACGLRFVFALTILMMLATFTIAFILMIASILGPGFALFPLGLFQRGFLLVFGLLGLFPQSVDLYETQELEEEKDFTGFPSEDP